MTRSLCGGDYFSALVGLLLLLPCLSATTNLNAVHPTYQPLDHDWLHLHYDSSNFVCDNYEPLCNNFLDGIGCAAANRTVSGCSPTLTQFKGKCVCTGVPIYMDMGSRIAKEIVDNRIKPEVGWMLEPWSTGPPYSVEASYPAICELMLARAGCREQDMTIAVGSKDGKTPYTCACGSFTAGSVRVQELICDQLNNAQLSELVIFQDPYTFSVEFSIAVVLIAGKVGSLVASAMYLPPIIGFLLSGVLIQDIISTSLIKGVGGDGPHATPFGEIRVFALIIVLLRAGLTTDPSEFLRHGALTTLMGFLPYALEFIALMFIGAQLFQWSIVDAGLMASIVAALSPSLVIPGMLKMVQQEHLGFAPQAVLLTAPIEVVLAIILYGIFASVESTSGKNPVYPWVHTLPLWLNLVLIPVNIVFSSIIGGFAGWVVMFYLRFRHSGHYLTKYFPKTIGETTFATVVTAYTLYSVCVAYYIPQTSGVLAVFAFGVALNKLSLPPVATCDSKATDVHPIAAEVQEIRTILKELWVFLEVFLFTTTGLNLSFKPFTGPTQSDRGVTAEQVAKLMSMLALGSVGRGVGVLVSGVVGFYSNPSEKLQYRRSWRYIGAWWLATWAFQWPKATVQATLGVLPYQNHVIPGSSGLTHGLFILRASAFAILIQAPIGVLLTSMVGKPLALYIHEMDEAHHVTDAKVVPSSDDKDDEDKEGDSDDDTRVKVATLAVVKEKYLGQGSSRSDNGDDAVTPKDVRVIRSPSLRSGGHDDNNGDIEMPMVLVSDPDGTL